MSRARKTVNVREVVERCNRYLASDHSTKQGREAIAYLASQTLHDANAYRGFNYLASEFVFPWWEYGNGSARLRANYDDSRRFYYLPE